MPATKKRTEIRVGLFIFAGLFLLGGLVLQFGKFRERLSGQYKLTVVFDDASGVIKGSEIRMGGARIGEVSSLPELNEEVKVEVELSIKDAIRIPAGSQFQINSATLLGDKLIVVIPPADRSGGSIAPDSRLQGAGLTGLDAIQNNAEEVSKDVLRIIKEAEETFSKVDAAVVDLRDASTHLRAAIDKVNQSMLSDKNLERFDKTLDNLASATGQWKAASAGLEPTLKEAREAVASVKKAADGAESTIKSANQAITGLKPSIERIPKAVDQFTSTSRKAGDALDRIKDGEGVLGALASDNDVALDVKTFMRNLKEYGILLYKNPDTAKPVEKDKKSTLPSLGSRLH
jgi:phospholipid/cholesterol/gamma-HCH transport system substrate-binding protein